MFLIQVFVSELRVLSNAAVFLILLTIIVANWMEKYNMVCFLSSKNVTRPHRDSQVNLRDGFRMHDR